MTDDKDQDKSLPTTTDQYKDSDPRKDAEPRPSNANDQSPKDYS